MICDIERALRAALRGKPTRGLAQAPAPRQAITVTVSARPADDRGPNILVVVTTPTISEFEARLAALKQAKQQGLRAAVIIGIEKAN